MRPVLVWYRLDLRVADHQPLLEAVARGAPIVPVFVWAPDEEEPWAPGAASRVWLHESLRALEGELRDLGSRLVLRLGPSDETLRALAVETDAQAVFFQRRYEPAVRARDERITRALEGAGLEVRAFGGALLHEPWELRTAAGGPFQVFTPFWRAARALAEPPRPRQPPAYLRKPSAWPTSLPLEALRLLPRIDWTQGIRRTWQPGEAGARTRLRRFLEEGRLATYEAGRDHPGLDAASALSPHLHFGELSAPQVYHAVVDQAATAEGQGAPAFLRELGWREFSHHLLWHFPRTPDRPLRPEFERFPHGRSDSALRAWQRGRTGYPLVDAGMRQLWETGFMHNRVRMVVASFLVKHLLLPWQEGARWFWDTLVDADLAQNTMGWQWTAGCGADAAPFFRIFNPVLQSERFDADGRYLRRWIPELATLETKWLHKPWMAPPEALAAARVILGETYPEPIVEHEAARQRALEAYAMVTGNPVRRGPARAKSNVKRGIRAG